MKNHYVDRAMHRLLNGHREAYSGRLYFWDVWFMDAKEFLEEKRRTLLVVVIMLLAVMILSGALKIPGLRFDFDKPLVKVAAFNQRPADLLGQPSIFSAKAEAKETKIYAYLIRGIVGSTNFDEKVKDYLQKHPQDAVSVSPIGGDAEKSILIFTNNPPDREYFRVSRK